MKKTLLRDSWRKLERAGPDQLLMETDQQRFRPRAYMYRESADPDNGFLELMRSLREPWLLHLATGEHFSPPTMKILKTALEPCEVEVLHLRYCQKDRTHHPAAVNLRQLATCANIGLSPQLKGWMIRY